MEIDGISHSRGRKMWGRGVLYVKMRREANSFVVYCAIWLGIRVLAFMMHGF